MERGEVYYLRYDDSYGHEMATGRPVVVISSDVGIDRCDVVTIAFLTSKYKQININVEVNCTPRRSWVLCNQLATVDKRRLGDKMCKLSPSELAEVDEKICDALGLWSVVKEVEVEKVVEVEVGKPVAVDDAEKIRLQIELDLYKKLYTDLTSQIVDARFERQVVVEKATATEEKATVTFIDEIVAPEVATEYIPNNGVDVDTETLKKKMFTPNSEMVEEPPKKKIGRPVGSKNKPKKVNINTADWETIREITGMNEKTAKNIVRYRKKHGDFVDLTDLLFVPYFGSGCMDKFGQMLEV